MSGLPVAGLPARQAPGPWAPPVLGAATHFIADPLKRFVELTAKYGPIVSLGPMGGVPFFLVTGPELNKYVLLDNNKNYRKGRAARTMASAFGSSGSLLLEGESWLVRRRLLQPAFHKKKIAAHGAAFVEAGEQLLTQWRRAASRNEAIDVREDALKMAMRLTVRNFFHADLTGDLKELMECWQVIYEFMSENRFSPVQLPAWIQTPRRKRFAQARAVVDRVLLRLIRERRAAGNDGSMLGMLIEARDADTGESMSDEQLRDELMVLFVGGYETSSNALAFTFGLLAQHRHLAKRLQHELDTQLQGRRPTFEDLSRIPYVRMLLDESMRLYPPSWCVTREAMASDVVGGCEVPAGAQVVVGTYAVHHDPKVWADPEVVRPERFDPQTASHHRFAYLPFGGGPRLCLGDQYALIEISLIIAVISQHLELRHAAASYLEPQAHLGLRPRVPIRLFAEERKVSPLN